MPSDFCPKNEQVLSGLSNEEFLQRYAKAGRVGLSSGLSFIDRAICRAERHLDKSEQWGSWSHAFLFQGLRADGQHWVIESDLQIHRKHIQLGVQENRISKYFDERLYSNLVILDFGLSELQVSDVLAEALDLVSNHAKYSLRELFGTLIALRRPDLRSRNNVLARESSMYCSAFVQHLFKKGGLDLAPGIDIKNTTPEDIARTEIPHTRWLLQRQSPTSALLPLKTGLRRLRARARLTRIKKSRSPEGL
jgi:hypothetical protein